MNNTIRRILVCMPFMLLLMLITANVGLKDAQAGSEDGAIVTVDNKESGNTGEPGDLVLETTTVIKQETQTKAQASKGGSNIVKNIRSKKAKIISANRNKKKKTRAKVRIKRVRNVSGYQVKVSLSKKMKKYRICSSRKNQVTLKKLKSKKKYYVRARVYIKLDKKKIYGKWSGRKTIK